MPEAGEGSSAPRWFRTRPHYWLRSTPPPWSAAFAMPRPDAPGTPHLRLSYVQIGTPAELYIRNIIPDDMGIPSPASPGPIGVGLKGISGNMPKRV
jgi:hypothetical protein